MKFIILCYPRTGSTLLITALGTHPNICQGMDIFNPEQEGDDPWVHWRRQTLENLYGHQDSYLNDQKKLDGDCLDLSLLAQTFFKDFDGTKLMYDHLGHNSSVWDYLRSKQDLRVIVLTRNIVEAAISFRVAMTTNIWFSPNVHSPIWYVPGSYNPPPSPSLTYETWYFDWFYQYYCSGQNYFTGLFAQEAQLWVDYTDLVTNWDATLTKIQAHLGVDPIVIPKMFEKRTQGNLTTLVENHEQILKHYQDHPILASHFQSAFQIQDFNSSQNLTPDSPRSLTRNQANPVALDFSKTFCILPFYQTVIDNKGKIKLCSQTLALDLESEGEILSLENMNLDKAWNSAYFRKLRHTLVTGEKAASCQKCYQKEQDGGTSLRQVCNAHFPTRTIPQTREELEAEIGNIITNEQGQAPFPSALHLWLGNTCNLKCRMCSQQYSSSIAQDPVHSRWYGGNSQGENSVAWSGQEATVFEQVLAHPENLRFINFSGGEPLINPSFIPILEWLIKQDAASHISLYINTNGTKYSQKISRLLQQFQDVELAVSVDGFESVQNYIRYPCRWEKICFNILAFKQDNLRVSIRPTIQAYNIFSLLDLVRWCDDKKLSFYLDHILTEPRFLSLDMLPQGVINEALEEWEGYLNKQCAPANLWHVETLIAALNRPRPSQEQLQILQNSFSRFTKEIDQSRQQSLAVACPRLYQSLVAYGVNFTFLPALDQSKTMAQPLTQALATVTSCEVNNQHGSGSLIARLLTDAQQIISLRSLNLYGGIQEFGDLDFCVNVRDLSREEALNMVAQKISGHWVKQIYCVPYFSEDIILALSLQKICGAPMAIHLMEDRNINFNDIGDDLMTEFLSQASLRLVTHPEIREAYENKYGLKFWLLPSVVSPALMADPPVLPKDAILYPNSVGALIGALEPTELIESLKITLTTAGISLDWYNGASGIPEEDPFTDLQTHPEWVQQWGLHPRGILAESELVENLRSYPYLVIPVGTRTVGSSDQNPRLWRVLLAVAAVHRPVIVLGNLDSSCAHFIKKFQLGLVCNYDGEELKQAVEKLCQPEIRDFIFHQSRELAPQLTSDGLSLWLKQSLAIGKPKDFRFEKLLAYSPGEGYQFSPPSPPVLSPEEVYRDFPHTIVHAYEGHIVGANHVDYVDMMSAWGSNILGYGHPRVAQAISEQSAKYANTGWVGPEWYQLESLLLRLVPGVEAIHLVKNGSDATAAAVRLARHITKRDIVLHRGYHGVQDWYMASLCCPGVPESQRAQIVTLDTLDVQTVAAILKAHPQQVACLIIDPMVWPIPDRETLTVIHTLLQEAGTLLIFDEVVSGFRIAPGGAQEFWQIQADLVCYGKCLANGLPLAILAGGKSLMAKASEINYGLTFGLEAVSIVAAVATISEIVEREICSELAEKGRFLKHSYDQLCQNYGIESALVGHDCRPELWFSLTCSLSPDFCKNLLIRELSTQGVCTYGIFNLCYAHTQKDLDQVVIGLQKGLEILASLWQAPQNWDRKRTEILGQKVETLQDQLKQSEQTIKALNEQWKNSQYTLHKTLTEKQELARELDSQFQQALQNLTEARAEIEAMQTSKFWCLRTQWFRLKRKLGLPIT
ncbi:twitch domain-containing radical SAM protein [Synechocystis salina]|nr:twitch domain-containing radical SAM protein [Synechocystis salina]